MVEEYCIDNELLISLVEQRPVLWDKNMDLYKNRAATQAAWKEIMMALDPNYETLEQTSRQAYAKLVIQRWTHIRDNYNRSSKKIQDQKRLGLGFRTVKPYVYSKQLGFLQNVIQPKETTDAFTEKDTESQESNEGKETPKTSSGHSLVQKPGLKRPSDSSVSPLDAKMMKFLDSYVNEPKVTNRHLSFFHGILPTIDKFDDDEVLEFQMGVIQLMKEIKNNRQNRLKDVGSCAF